MTSYRTVGSFVRRATDSPCQKPPWSSHRSNANFKIASRESSLTAIWIPFGNNFLIIDSTMRWPTTPHSSFFHLYEIDCRVSADIFLPDCTDLALSYVVGFIPLRSSRQLGAASFRQRLVEGDCPGGNRSLPIWHSVHRFQQKRNWPAFEELTAASSN